MKKPHVTILQTSFAKRDDTIAFLKNRVPGVRVEFITDSTILEDVRKNGAPTKAVYDRMKLYAKAAEISGADLIVNSCSTVGEVADVYAKEVKVPVMKIEDPMCKAVVACGSNFAVVGTVETSMGPVARIIERLGREQGKVIKCKLLVQNEAWDSLIKDQVEEHNRILLQNIYEIDTKGYDAIVMSQVSMRALLPELKVLKTPIFCSFYSGYGAVADKLNEIAKEG